MTDLPDPLGQAGVVMAIAGVVVTAVTVVALVPRALRVGRRAQALRASVAGTEEDLRRAIALLAARRAETAMLLRPWERIARWARHPLVAATIEWYLRRRGR